MVIMRLIDSIRTDIQELRELMRESNRRREELKKFAKSYRGEQLPPVREPKPPKENGLMFLLRKRLEMQAKLDTLANTLKSKEMEFDIERKRRDAEATQRIKDGEAEFNRRIAHQQNEFTIKETQLKDEHDRMKKRLEEEHKLEIDKIVALTKLNSDQEIAKAKLEADQRVARVQAEKDEALSLLKAKHAEEISKVKQEEAQQHYSRMTEAMTKMNTEGSVLTKNMHELSMKLLDRASGMNVQETRFLTGRIDGQPGSDPKTVVVNKDGEAATVVT